MDILHDCNLNFRHRADLSNKKSIYFYRICSKGILSELLFKVTSLVETFVASKFCYFIAIQSNDEAKIEKIKSNLQFKRLCGEDIHEILQTNQYRFRISAHKIKKKKWVFSTGKLAYEELYGYIVNLED